MTLSRPEQQFLDAWLEHAPEDSAPMSQYKIEGIGGAFDFAWPLCMIAVEIYGYGAGGMGGGHQRPGRQAADAAKIRAATALGWTVVPITSTCLGSREKREDLVHEVLTIIGAKGTWDG